jgi:hypothetical protein
MAGSVGYPFEEGFPIIVVRHSIIEVHAQDKAEEKEKDVRGGERLVLTFLLPAFVLRSDQPSLCRRNWSEYCLSLSPRRPKTSDILSLLLFRGALLKESEVIAKLARVGTADVKVRG